jgi:hypothetical protein
MIVSTSVSDLCGIADYASIMFWKTSPVMFYKRQKSFGILQAGMRERPEEKQAG